MNDTDRKILLAHDPRCRARCAIELHLVRLTIAVLRAAGYSMTFDNGGERIQAPQDAGEAAIDRAVEHLFSVDEARICARKFGAQTSFVFFVFGNDGHDVICDYGVSLDDVLKPVNDEADAICDGQKTIGFQL